MDQWLSFAVVVIVSLIAIFAPGRNKGVIRRSVVMAWVLATAVYILMRWCGCA